MSTTRNLIRRALPVLFAASVAAPLLAQPARPAGTDDGMTEEQRTAAEGRLLSNVRLLTQEGRRAGEGYFSADGRWMIYQAEAEADNPFYQIYLMELETGRTRRISNGVGKTTCAWLHPDGRKALFASTHEDPQARDKQRAEIELRERGEQRRYEWDFDEHYDIYEVDLESLELRPLTRARGYDAEGSYSPDGRLIAFASNRHAYEPGLSDAEREAFEKDPASMMEIYIMNADGSGVRRLTHSVGYDGGPFFSPDGQRLCWRRFSPDGRQAEIYTMRIDGGDVRQLTELGAMSWAPYYHPSSDYLIFTTSVHGMANFELYIVDVDGRRAPQRVTYTPGFDGLPVFLPDGRRLAWSSSRTPSRQAQIFIAEWNHDEARRRLADAPPRKSP